MDNIRNAVNERPYRVIERKKTRVVHVGNVKIGGDNPIVVQTMTNADAEDVESTVAQIKRCVDAGAELVRVSVPTKESTIALKEIVKRSDVPIIADVHFHYKRGIEAIEAGAKCIRINPGNIGSDDRAREIVKVAKDYDCAIRIGVNTGSLGEEIMNKYSSPCPEALVESAINSIKILEDLHFFNTKISVKATDVILMIKSYELLSSKCDYPLHLGVTEAGTLMTGSVRSSLGMGRLLLNGIGDTIRVSLSNPPEEELPVAYEILKSLYLRERGVNLIACPSCSRQQFDVIKLVNEVEDRTRHIVESINVSILGCVVNGLGEAEHTYIGITGAGSKNHLIYKNGKPFSKVTEDKLADEICRLIEERAEEIRAGK